MGLDSFWKAPGNVELPEPVFNPPLALCGGMFSGHGAGSFRGKVYAYPIEHVTGVSIYAEVLSNETVRRMADALDNYPYGGVIFNVDDAEMNDLRRMFRAYADGGFELHGWW